MCWRGLQGSDRLHPRAEVAHGDPRRKCSPSACPTDQTAQSVQLVFGYHRLYGCNLHDLMPLRLGILPLEWVLAMPALAGLHGYDALHLFHGEQRPGLPLMPKLPPWSPSAGVESWPLHAHLGRIARRGPRGGTRVLLHPLFQVLDGCLQPLHGRLQGCHPRFEGANVALDGCRDLLPQLWRERTLGIHGPRYYAAWAATGKHFST
jgi:hypothetical protein